MAAKINPGGGEKINPGGGEKLILFTWPMVYFYYQQNIVIFFKRSFDFIKPTSMLLLLNSIKFFIIELESIVTLHHTLDSTKIISLKKKRIKKKKNFALLHSLIQTYFYDINK